MINRVLSQLYRFYKGWEMEPMINSSIIVLKFIHYLFKSAAKHSAMNNAVSDISNYHVLLAPG